MGCGVGFQPALAWRRFPTCVYRGGRGRLRKAKRPDQRRDEREHQAQREIPDRVNISRTLLLFVFVQLSLFLFFFALFSMSLLMFVLPCHGWFSCLAQTLTRSASEVIR